MINKKVSFKIFVQSVIIEAETYQFYYRNTLKNT